MFEATLVEGSFLKKVFDAIKDLVVVGNIYCSATGLSLKAHYCHRLLRDKHPEMPLKDSHSGEYYVGVLLGSERFRHYRCDKDISRKIDIEYMAMILECAEDDDIITLKADDVDTTFTLVFESPSKILKFVDILSLKFSFNCRVNGESLRWLVGYLFFSFYIHCFFLEFFSSGARMI